MNADSRDIVLHIIGPGEEDDHKGVVFQIVVNKSMDADNNVKSLRNVKLIYADCEFGLRQGTKMKDLFSQESFDCLKDNDIVYARNSSNSKSPTQIMDIMKDKDGRCVISLAFGYEFEFVVVFIGDLFTLRIV